MHFPRLVPIGIALLLAACGKIPDEPGPDGGPDGAPANVCDIAEPSLAQIYECAFRTSCKQAIACGAAFSDEETCYAFLTGNPDFVAEQQRIAEAIAGGRQQIDYVAYRACIDSLQAAVELGDCEGDLGSEACESLFIGQVASGGGCFENNDCGPPGSRCDSNCQPENQCCAGFCLAAVAVGATCGDGIPCQRGLECVGAAGAQTCVDGDPGSACDQDYQCDKGLHCAANVCKTDFAENAPCGRDDECVSGLRCVTGKCSTAGEGDACVNSCAEGFWCEIPPAGGPGTCHAIPAEIGADCVGATRCVPGLICRDTKCQALSASGEACVDNGCVAGFFCASELEQTGTEPTCIRPLANGSICDSDRHCMSGVCLTNDVGLRTCVGYQVCE